MAIPKNIRSQLLREFIRETIERIERFEQKNILISCNNLSQPLTTKLSIKVTTLCWLN